MFGPISGKNAPKMDRMKTSAATADAAVDKNASTAYVWQGTKMPRSPKPKGMNDMHGAIQCTEARVVHAYMNRAIGMKGAK